MASKRMLGEVLEEYRGQKKNGALFVAVKEKSENLVRFFLSDGQIRHLSYGPCSGRDCLDIMDCYEFTTAYFVKDMKAPAISPDLPSTEQIIEKFRQSGREVMLQ